MSLALLFPPQGSQRVGMGRELAAASPAAREVFEVADAVLGWPVSRTCWEGPKDRLDDTRQTQPCLLAASVAAWRALGERIDLRPAAVAGHSVGEYAALVAAGALGLADALRIVARRAELMAGQGETGGMTAVIGLAREKVADAVARIDGVVVANDNAPGQVVISGGREALRRAEAAARRAGARRTIRLPVSGAFHSPAMAPVAEALAVELGRARWDDAEPAVISNVTAEPLRASAAIRGALAVQVCSPVEWVRSVERMAAEGIDTFVECGPGAALSGMVGRILSGARTLSVADPAGLEAAVAALGAPAAV